jgi:uncharacterized membrane protein
MVSFVMMSPKAPLTFKQAVRKNFLTGLVVLLPVLLTAYFCWLLFMWSGQLFGQLLVFVPYLRTIPHLARVAMGFVLLLLIIYGIGVLASHLIGRRLLKLWEGLLVHTPFVRIVYSTSKQFTETFFSSKYAFRQVVAVEYPRPGTYALGFLTSDHTWALGRRRTALTVYLPNTPNPTGGRILIVPPQRLFKVEMTVEEAIKLIVSGGMIAPDDLRISTSIDRDHAKPIQAARRPKA